MDLTAEEKRVNQELADLVERAAKSILQRLYVDPSAFTNCGDAVSAAKDLLRWRSMLARNLREHEALKESEANIEAQRAADTARERR